MSPRTGWTLRTSGHCSAPTFSVPGSCPLKSYSPITSCSARPSLSWLNTLLSYLSCQRNSAKTFRTTSTRGTRCPLLRIREVRNVVWILPLNLEILGRRIGTPEQGSPVVSTIFTFVDREASLKAQQGNQTDQALAQLYAHVQSKSNIVCKFHFVPWILF